MLIQFNFSNFKSFRDEVSLDMSATKITEHPHHIVKIGNEKLLPVVSLFGANASGKSNVIEAFRFMRAYVNRSFAYGDEISDEPGVVRKLASKPFLLDSEANHGASSFEVYFVASEEMKNRTYNYGFSIMGSEIQEEWLNSRAKSSSGDFKRVFYRSTEELDLSSLSSSHRENLEVALSEETLVVSLGSKLRIPELKYVRDWFLGCIVASFGSPVENLFLSGQVPDGFVDDKSVQKDVLNFFATFDTSIIDFEVEAIEDESRADRAGYKIGAVHRMIASDDTVSIPLGAESAGTLKMFALFPLVKDVFKSGGVLFVDELNARLHPLLVRTLLISFLDPTFNKKHAQLIFTSHEPWHMSNRILRRDEVWLVEKADNGVSSLYSLADFVCEDGLKIRKDENYERNYLLGKYGAIPSMNHFDFLGEEW